METALKLTEPSTRPPQDKDALIARLRLANEAKRGTKTARSESAYRPHGDTERDWLTLAREAGVRLPVSATALTTARMAAWLRKIGVTGTQYTRWQGGAMDSFAQRNPGWNLRCWAGLVLEHREQIKEATR